MAARKFPRNALTVSMVNYRPYSARSTTTVNQEEVNFFVSKSEDWWDTNGPMRLLLKMNALRLPMVQDFLTTAGLAHFAYSDTKTPLRGIQMLDVGCGGGLLSEELAKRGADVTGVDAGGELVQVARAHMQRDAQLHKHLRYEQALIEDYSRQHRERFDAVVSSEVIEHVNEPETFVKNCVECLKPGGSIIFTTMDRTPPGGLHNIVFLEHIYKSMPKGTHSYAKFVRPRELEHILQKYGCRTVGVQGFTVNAFTEHWFKVPVTWFNYALHAIKGEHISDQTSPCKYATYAKTENV